MKNIIVVSHNNLSFTKKAVNSALMQGSCVNILPIDHSSADGTKEWLRSKGVRWISVGPTSLAHCWNLGLAYMFNESNEDEVLVCNNDIELLPQTYELLASGASKYDLISGVGVGDRKQFTLPDRYTPAFNSHPHFACFLITRRCWEAVGEFDENFRPAYFEDNDYHLRIHKAGLQAVCMDVPFLHHSSTVLKHSSPEEKVHINRSFLRNKMYFKSKWGCYPATPEYEELFAQLPLGR